MRTLIMTSIAAALLFVSVAPADAGPFHQIRKNKHDIADNSADIQRLNDAFDAGYEELDGRFANQNATDEALADAIQDVRTRAKRWAAATASLDAPHIEAGDTVAVNIIGSSVSGEGSVGLNIAAKLPVEGLSAFAGVASASSEQVGRAGVNFSF